MTQTTLPWKHSDFDGWSIVGMNHYHINKVRFLFVAMTRGTQCIKVEDCDDHALWERLRLRAMEAMS